MTKKPTCEELQQRIKELETEAVERQRVEEMLRESEEKYRIILETIEDGYYEVDIAGDFTFFNDSLCEIMGYTRDELMGMNNRHYMDGETARKVYESYNKVYTTGKPDKGFEYEMIRKDGTSKNVEVSISLIKDSEGQRIGFRGIVRDVTKRKRAEEELRKSEKKYRQLIESLNEGIWSIDKDSYTTFVNQPMAEMLGYTPEEMLGKDVFFFMDEDGKKACESHLERRKQGIKEQHDFEFLRRDGTRVYTRLVASPITDDEGMYIGGIASVIDITEQRQAEEALREARDGLEQRVQERTAELVKANEQLQREIQDRKKAEKALRASEEEYGTLVEDSLTGIYIDQDGKIVFANRKLAEIYGYSREELAGMESWKLVHPEDRPLTDAIRRKRVKGEEAPAEYEARGLTKDGETRWIVRRNTRIEYQGRPAILGNVVDVTKRKRAEEALVGAKEDWENTFDAITDMVMLLDNEHRIVRTNTSTAEAFNTTEELLVGKKCYEVVHGQSQPVEKCPLITTTQTRKPSSREVAVPRIDRTCICSTSPILDHEENLIGYTHTLKDITESKRLEAQLQQAQKMEAIGTLAGGIAHDFNNVLMGIQGNISLMLLDVDSAHPHHEKLERIEKQIQRASRLTSHLLGYARKGRYEIKPLNVNQLVEETSHTFGRTKKGITIHRDLAEDLFVIEADPGQIEQILWNLYVNAADAMPSGGDLILKTMNVTDKDIKGGLYDPKPGNYVLLTVTDTGAGMDKKTMGRVFDPFFTTKEMGRGTGLGLASAYGIMKAHGGYIDVDSKKGQGATFSICLPASDKEVPKAVKSAERFTEGSGTVLLVDDEEVILEVGQELLETMGYRVLLARNGQEAVEVYEMNRDNIDIVVMDMVMPKMGGGEAYDRMKEINPDIKALLSSGFSIDGEASEILERGCDGFIQKPFAMKDLSRKISEILERE